MYDIQAQNGSYKLNDLCKLDCPGVFDLRWRRPQTEFPCVTDVVTEPGGRNTDDHGMAGVNLGEDSGMMAALALADGSCQLVSISRDAISAVATQADAACGGMTLSCDWAAFGATDVFCSASNGMVSHCRVTESTLENVQQWQAHTLEVWMVTCDRHQVLPPGSMIAADTRAHKPDSSTHSSLVIIHSTHLPAGTRRLALR